MSTVTRPELSQKNKYYIEKHRYYELKHFCLQYPIWKKAYNSLDGLAKRPSDLFIFSKSISNPTESCALVRQFYTERMSMVEQACKMSEIDIWNELLLAVTEGQSYESLRMIHGIPCCRDTYYDAYRRFFYILNKLRN